MIHPPAHPRVPAIQLLRALAALMVVLLHTTHEAQAISGHAPGTYHEPAFPLVMGVDLFFVISGFVMVVASTELFQSDRGPKIFFFRRLSRIVPPYWLATGLFLLMFLATPHAINSEAPSFGNILRSFLFVPYGPEPVYKVGWTLNYEMFFYVCFSLIISMQRLRGVVILTMTFLCLVILGFVLQPNSPIFRFWTAPIILEFIMGAWIGLIFLSKRRLGWQTALLLALIGISCPFFGFRVDPFGLLGRSLYWGLPAAFLVAACSLSAELPDLPCLMPFIFLGNASYALYLWHPFVIRLTKNLWNYGHLGRTFGLRSYVAASMALAVIAACVIYRFVEKPATAVVQKILGVANLR
jgi:exopolysaccharide production protein ExoZ